MSHVHSLRIWGFAFGYFACYVPYALVTKRVSSGYGLEHAWSGMAILPIATMASTVGMLIFITAMGWWKYAPQVRVGPLNLPRPRFVTFLSGVATAGIILTTTLAYTFDKLSIVFMMLLMRGGVLLLAPIVDRLTGRTFASIPWWSWAGSGLSLVSLLVAFGLSSAGGPELTVASALVVVIYLGGYFFRLSWMSSRAKAFGPGGREQRLAFFVEEQMIATPFAMLVLGVLALTDTTFGADLRAGFSGLEGDVAAILWVVFAGLCSQGTGAFGALVLLEPQENAYTVPVNRAASVLAGVVASFILVALGEAKVLPAAELGGAAIIILAIVVLSWPVWRRMFARATP